jgi:hypothetical protein
LAEEPEITNETPTKEDYAAIKLELEAEKAKTQEAIEQATKPFQERVTELEATLASLPTTSELKLELEAMKGQLAEASTNFEGAKAAYAYAVEDFKKLVLQANPFFTPDIIWGDTIDDVKTSVEKAGVLVSKVKEGLEAQARALAGLTTVPAGAPARTGPNTEGLSTKEKINLGMEQARKKKEQ